MVEQARYVPRDLPGEDCALRAALEAIAEGCEVDMDELVEASQVQD